MSQQPGLVAQHLGRPRDASSTDFIYVTVWQDVDSIRAFAGEHWEEAVIAADAEDFLSGTWIGHFEAIELSEG